VEDCTQICSLISYLLHNNNLTCPLDSTYHIQFARDRKQNEVEYLQLLAEFDRLTIANYYETIEITVLGH